jgi:hypothetical protein
MKKITLVLVLLFIVSLFVSCSGGNNIQDKEKISDVIRNYVASYNASNFEETISYFTGYSDRQDAIDYLTFLKSMSGNLTLVNFNRDSVAVTGNTARVPVEFIIMGEQSSQWINLVKENGSWKMLWTQ